MPTIPLHFTSQASSTIPETSNPLPSILRIPSGLAILEIQGTIHISNTSEMAQDTTPISGSVTHSAVGHFEFPLYNPATPQEAKWMKKVYLYVGKYQRMTGEVKTLPKPLAIIQRRPESPEQGPHQFNEDLEIVDIVKFKLLFSGRPEPVGEE